MIMLVVYYSDFLPFLMFPNCCMFPIIHVLDCYQCNNNTTVNSKDTKLTLL